MKKKNVALIASAIFLTLALVILAGVLSDSILIIPPSTPTASQVPVQHTTTAPTELTTSVNTATEPVASSIPSVLSDVLAVHFLDIGQAESILIQLPDGRIILIDGGEADSAETIISYLINNGITKIDFLLVTHPHADHIGGLPAIIEAMDIASVFMPRVSQNTQIFEELLTAIENKGLRIDKARAGVEIVSAPELQVDIIAPVNDNYKNINGYSMVIRITYGNTSFLLTGDAESLTERELIANFSDDALSTDVLKVAHHGSSTSTSAAFLKKVCPSYAVICVGMNNFYKHPSDKILSRLEALEVKIYRTDINGTIVFTSNGSVITVQTYKTTIFTPSFLPMPAPEPALEATEITGIKDIEVWLAATSNRYHSINNCGNMNPQKARQVTLEYAIANYVPCLKCN